ncbi:MAG: hypothetical protein WBG86_06970 [Polyangiales bacterium]
MFSNFAREVWVHARHLVLLSTVPALVWAGCVEDTGGGTGGTAGSGGTGGSGGSLPDATLVVTADWLNQSLTLLDYDKLVDGQSDAEEAILGTIDLSDWEPGPLELEITPDGETAVVSVGPGFFDGSGLTNMIIGAPDVPPGGTLLIVDLATGQAESIATEDVPMGIAISPDGTRAYTANYGTTDARGDSLSIIDLVTRQVIEEVQVGSGPEQVVLSPDGSLGAINVAGADGVRIFQTADVAGTLTEIVPTGNDPSDIAFLGGNTRIIVTNSQGFNVTLIDTSDPSAPSPIQNFATQGGVPYGVTYVPGRNIVLAAMSPLAAGLPANFVTIDIDGDVLTPSLPDALPGGSFPLTVGVDALGDFAFVAHVSDQEFSIIDLDTGDIRAISWLGPFGPTYVAVQR